ncbi:TPA: hypothetical protein HA278_07620 [Candidatus Woesearchaeota archaeon]|nr:hypothetical protein [Candidatus Woesearchaeota archaeon]
METVSTMFCLIDSTLVDLVTDSGVDGVGLLELCQSGGLTRSVRSAII